MFKVIGKPDDVDLYSSGAGNNQYDDCVQWLKRYVKGGNWGGYTSFDIVDEDSNVHISLIQDGNRAIWRMTSD